MPSDLNVIFDVRVLLELQVWWQHDFLEELGPGGVAKRYGVQVQDSDGDQLFRSCSLKLCQRAMRPAFMATSCSALEGGRSSHMWCCNMGSPPTHCCSCWTQQARAGVPGQLFAALGCEQTHRGITPQRDFHGAEGERKGSLERGWKAVRLGGPCTS